MTVNWLASDEGCIARGASKIPHGTCGVPPATSIWREASCEPPETSAIVASFWGSSAVQRVESGPQPLNESDAKGLASLVRNDCCGAVAGVPPKSIEETWYS